MSPPCPTSLIPLRRYLALRLPQMAAHFDDEFERLYSRAKVAISSAHFERMNQAIRDIESVVTAPAWREAVLARADANDAIVQYDNATHGMFYGYDFHLGAQGPSLIEINTNAGGAWLNLGLSQALCQLHAADDSAFVAAAQAIEAPLVAMFRREWALFGGDRPLRSVAIVDDDPEKQFLFPEFLLAQAILQAHGIATHIADPRDLERRDQRVFWQDQPIDLIYNRMTDFFLREPHHADLRAAILDHQVAFTPSPRSYALVADKRNLAWLSDPQWLTERGFDAALVARITAVVPPTEIVTKTRAEAYWQQRRELFFKPRWGFGGKAAYRGAKLTKTTFQAILEDDYVAQTFVAPSEVILDLDGQATPLKVDFRNFTYDATVQVIAARVYQGQTTNFRTAGGGFAPVFVTP